MRLISLAIGGLIGCFTMLLAAPAWAGGDGPDSCPAGYSSYTIPDDSAAGIANSLRQLGGHGRLAPVLLPAGRYAILYEGDTGPRNNPPNAPYLALCGNDRGRAGRPILATAQGQAYANYEVPLSYMDGGPIVTSWLPAGVYQSITPDTTTYATLQRIAGPPEIAWWQYALLAIGIAALLLALSLILLIRRRRAKAQAAINSPQVP